MRKTEVKGPDGSITVKWTDTYGVEITEGSLITYAVKGSTRVRIQKARVTRTDSRYIYVQVSNIPYYKNGFKLETFRNTRLYATNNIIVCGKVQETN